MLAIAMCAHEFGRGVLRILLENTFAGVFFPESMAALTITSSL